MISPHRHHAAERERSEFLDAYDAAIKVLRSTFSGPESHLIADVLSRYRDVLAKDSRLRAHIDRHHEIHKREIEALFSAARTENRRK